MLYIKAKLNNQVEIKVDLYEDEIFTSCGDCGKEMNVDQDMIMSIFNDEGDFAGTTFFCEECSQKRISKREARVCEVDGCYLYATKNSVIEYDLKRKTITVYGDHGIDVELTHMFSEQEQTLESFTKICEEIFEKGILSFD